MEVIAQPIGESHSAAEGRSPLTSSRRHALQTELQRHGVTLCYWFGSTQSGVADSASDVDLGVVLREHPAKEQRIRLWDEILDGVQPLFGSRQVDLVLLQCVPLALQWEAISGELVFAADDLARADYEEHVMRLWMDFQWWYDKQLEESTEAIRGGCF